MRQRRVHHAHVPGPEAELALDAEESHHLRSVLRLRPGDAVSVFDGRGGEWDALVLATEGSVRLRTGAPRTDSVEAALHVHLLQGLCRPDRMEWAIQKATEVGVRCIQPVLLERSEERPPSTERLVRWRRIAQEAAKQSGRRLVPEVREAASPPSSIPPGTQGIVLVPGNVPGLGAALQGAAPPAVWLLVGPEGGLAEEEVAALVRGGFRPAGLGPRTLRTETAGVVAAALVLHAWGDLGPLTVSSPATVDGEGSAS